MPRHRQRRMASTRVTRGPWLASIVSKTSLSRIKRTALASLTSVFLLPADCGLAQQSAKTDVGSAAAADQIADIFSKVGDQIYEDCIFELSQEQIEVQLALIQAYMRQGASGAVARRLAATQIQPPKLSARCEQVRRSPEASSSSWVTKLAIPKQPAVKTAPKLPPEPTAPVISLASKKGLPQWDCAPNVDFVTIHLNGYERKLTGGEICNPFEDVVSEVPASVRSFKLGYTIKTGRLFIISDNPQASGKTIAWGISGRDVCRNNPDPDCLAARAVGPLPPGEYSFAAEQDRRVSWGPRTKRQRRRHLFAETMEQGPVQRSANRCHPGARKYCHPCALEGRNVRGLHWIGAKGLGLCRFADQGNARYGYQRLYRRALSANRRKPACCRRLFVLAVLFIQVKDVRVQGSSSAIVILGLVPRIHLTASARLT